MHKESFKIDAWDTEEPLSIPTNQNQLKSLQDLLHKIKYRAEITKPQIMQKHFPTFYDQKSFLSAKLDHSKIKNEINSSKHKLVQRQTFVQEPKERITLSKKIWNSTPAFAKSIKIIEKKLENIKNDELYDFRSIVKADSSIFFPKKKKRSKSMKNLTKKLYPRKKKEQYQQSPVKFAFNNSKHEATEKKLQPLSQEQQLKKLKTFFLKTLENIDQRNCPIKNKIYENRWRNMMNKSNQKKKALEELFRTRTVIDKKEAHKGAVRTKEQVFLLSNQINSSRNKVRCKSQEIDGEFGDLSMFCPWDYKPDRLKILLKSKRIS